MKAFAAHLLALLFAVFALAGVGRPKPRTIRLLDGIAPLAAPDRCDIDGDSREALTLRPGDERTIVTEIPVDATLRFAVGAPSRNAPATWMLRIEDIGDGRLLAGDEATVSYAWDARRLDLRAFAGRRVTIHTRVGGIGVPICWATPTITSGRAPAPLVVVFLLDTMRADHLSLFGYHRKTSPALEALARDGAVFEDFTSDASWTRASVATLMTGRPALEHGTLARDAQLRGEVTLARRLRAAGLRTVALSTNPNILPFWGFAEGFERFVDVDATKWTANSDAARVLNVARNELDESAGQALLLYVHINDAHAPYDPPAADAAQLLGSYDPHSPGRSLTESASPAELAGAIDRYDAEIAHADREIGRFLDDLRRARRYTGAVIVAVGDHGEEFLDHGGVYHGHTLFHEQLHVPLVIKPAGTRDPNIRVTSAASMPDVLPTILALLGVNVRDLPGHVLLTSDGRPVAVPALRYAATDLDTNTVYAVDDGRMTYIAQTRPRPQEWLFDNLTDPTQHHELPVAEPAGLRLRAALEARLLPLRTGWHVRVCGSDAPAVVTLSLTSATPLSRVEAVDFEPDDHVDILDDGHRVRLDAHVAPVARTEEHFGKLVTQRKPDHDEVVFAGEGPVTVAVEQGAMQLHIGAAETPESATVPDVPIARAQTTALFRPACDGAPGIWLWHVGESTANTTIDPQLLQRLRDLGYVR